MAAQQITATRSLRAELSTTESAQAYIYNCNQPSKWTSVLGDNGKVWVLSNRDASILVKAGYEYAE